ncbi:Asp/Glu/hydantoin racemase [Actinomadura algeriensis]|uniref:Asp/Glu/hydantoin racemase n=2 Tax=Actinomadura algeriensis TaxID=1679523 RepID=A0ABR9K292_9ACTN|nr:Asp/Glu/hydantoin racemase [Actinomadura algeriensis]
MTSMSPLVAIINAALASMAPAAQGLCEGFPEARPWHLLDDRLVSEADSAGGTTPALRRRMLALIDHAVRGGADAVLLSCSMYGPVAGLARQLHALPVLGSDQAMFAEIVRRAPDRAVVIGSLTSAVADSVARLEAALGASPTQVTGVMADGAAAAASAGDREALADALAQAARPHIDEGALFLLGQYSLTPAHAVLAERLGRDVLSPPLMAARLLRQRLLDAAPVPAGAR